MSPLVRSTSRPIWQRLPESNAFYYRKERNNNAKKAYVLSFLFEFDRPEDTSICDSYPYTYTDCRSIVCTRSKDNINWYTVTFSAVRYKIAASI